MSGNIFKLNAPEVLLAKLPHPLELLPFRFTFPAQGFPATSMYIYIYIYIYVYMYIYNQEYILGCKCMLCFRYILWYVCLYIYMYIYVYIYICIYIYMHVRVPVPVGTSYCTVLG